MSDSEELLRQASSVLAEATAYSNRAACWIGRAALEGVVDDLLVAYQRDAPDATMRSKLTVLQVAYEQDPDVVMRAEYAWNRLSQACHHHAYELTPAGSEVRHLLDLVATLVGRVSSNKYVLPT